MQMRKLETRSFLVATLIAATGLFSAPCGFCEDSPQAVDIKADQQEFAEGHVVARGKVRVVYGDTVIIGPLATLYRDESGSATRAVFTGGPRLVQGKSKINGRKLIFDIKSSAIVAEGNAHSEVYTDEETEEVQDQVATRSKKSTVSTSKVITDSDRQEYDRNNSKFIAVGNVRVKAGDIKVKAKHMKFIFGTNRKPEAAVFTGNAIAHQNKNVTQADTITYFLETKKLQATGHVRSRVIEKKSDDPEGKPKKKVAKKKAAKKPKKKKKMQFVNFGNTDTIDAPIYVFSDAQESNGETDRMDAVGNVRVYFKDTRGTGPHVTLLKNKYGKTERIIFQGRSQITQPGRKWIGDWITLTVSDRKVLAEGNTKAIIVKDEEEEDTGSSSDPPPEPTGSRLAGKGQLK